MWSFLNPMFLWAGLAATIPLILHLLARRRAVRIRFPTIRFLQRAQRQSSHRVRMENFLLWVLRTLLLLLLAFAFALPVVRSRTAGFLGRSRRDVAIVWDVSYSMTYETGGRKVWEDARQVVLNILGNLGAGDRACLYAAGEQVTALAAAPTPDVKFLEGQVRQQEPEGGAAALAPALRAACDALKESGSREREVYIVTDGQALTWSGFQAGGVRASETGATNQSAAVWDPEAVDERIVFFAALLGAGAPENSAPVEVQPSLLLSGTPAQLAVRTMQSGPARDTTLTLSIGGREVARQTLPAGQAATESTFPLPDLAPGVHAASVATAPDGLALDDVFHAVLRVRDRVPVLCVGDDGDLVFLSRALSPGARTTGMLPRVLAAGEWAPQTSQGQGCIFLCNAAPLGGAMLLELERYIRDGGLVAVFPGDRGGPTDYDNLSWLPAKPVGVDEIPAGSGRRTLRLKKPADPLFHGLLLPPGVVPAIALKRSARLAAPAADAETLIAMEDDAPLLMARPFGAGRVLLFTVSADRSWSSLPLTPIFLPLMHQIVRHGAGLVREPLWLPAGRDVVLPVSAGLTERSPLVAPDGSRAAVRPVQRDGRTDLQIDVARVPGGYETTDAAGTKRPVVAINVDRRESDLTPVEADDVSKLIGSKQVHVARDREELARRVEEHRVGRPLGELVLWIALVFAVLEFGMANRVSRRTAARRNRWTVEASGRVRVEGA